MSSSSESHELFPYGSISGLFYFPSTALVLMDYDEDHALRLLTMGPFEVKLVKQTISPILMAVCSVDGFQWPLTKDTVIIRINKRCFAIVLPGLFYGLQCLDAGRDTHIEILEGVFMQYGHYLDLNDTSLDYLYGDCHPLFWLKLRPVVQPMAHEMLSSFGHQPGKSRFHVPGENCCYKRAVRLSATTKLITNGMTSGTLKADHITVRGNKRAYEQVLASSSGSSNINTLSPAHASASVFVCLIDSVEAAWMISNGLSDVIKGTPPPLQTYPHPGFRVWRLNEMGLVAFIHDLADYAERELEIMRQKENSRANRARQFHHVSAEAIARARAHARGKDKGKGKGKQTKP